MANMILLSVIFGDTRIQNKSSRKLHFNVENLDNKRRSFCLKVVAKSSLVSVSPPCGNKHSIKPNGVSVDGYNDTFHFTYSGKIPSSELDVCAYLVDPNNHDTLISNSIPGTYMFF